MKTSYQTGWELKPLSDKRTEKLQQQTQLDFQETHLVRPLKSYSDAVSGWVGWALAHPENKLSDWMGIEAIVRQKDRESTAANIARLSGNTPSKTFKIVTVMSLVGGLDGLQPTWVLGFQLTLFQPGGADYAHHITAYPSNLKTLLQLREIRNPCNFE